MESASAGLSAAAFRRRLFAGLSGAVGAAPAVSMRRPGKAPLAAAEQPAAAAASDLPAAFPIAPDRVGWLQKATFGFSTPEDYDLLQLPGATVDAKWEAWVERQLAPASIADADCEARIGAAGFATLGKTLQQLWAQHYGDGANYYNRMLPVAETECATMIRAIYSKRQLFERVVNFWHDHFSVFGWEYDIGPIFTHYDRDVIRPNAFGNFRSLLEQVATSTAMQFYLDNYASRGADFNENYARELIELHTLGVGNYFGPGDPFSVECLDSLIHCPDSMPAGYVDNDVYEAAGALTGWTIKNGHWQYPGDNDGTFVYRSDWHDRRNKIFLGEYLPANQPAMQDGRMVFDRLVAHPGTARFVARKLCRRFVGDTPSQALVDAVAVQFNTHIAAPDQIARMLRTILLSAEFKTSWGTGMRRPFEVTMSALRGLGANFTPRPDNTSAWTTTERLVSHLQQAGHRSFAWSPPNGYPDRQTAWASTGSLAMTLKLLAWVPEMRVGNDGSSAFIADILAQTRAAIPDAAARTAPAIIGYWATRLLGYQPEPTVSVATAFLQQNAAANAPINIDEDVWNTGNLARHYTQQRLRTAVGMLLMSPDYFRR